MHSKIMIEVEYLWQQHWMYMNVHVYVQVCNDVMIIIIIQYADSYMYMYMCFESFTKPTSVLGLLAYLKPLGALGLLLRWLAHSVLHRTDEAQLG